jgi:hypothetical protein
MQWAPASGSASTSRLNGNGSGFEPMETVGGLIDEIFMTEQ